MKPETGYFSSFDRTKLFYRLWLKEVPVTVLIVHGFGEHSGRYAGLVRALEELPVSVVAYDLRGHGESDGPRVYVHRFDDFVKDLYGFRRFIEKKRNGSGNGRFFLLGQSLGGLIAANAALAEQNEWERLILLSPFFGLQHHECFLRKLTYFLDLFAGRLIWANPIPPLFLTHDQEALGHYRKDALIQRRITIHLAHEMFHAIWELHRRARELSLPLFVLAAGNDKIVALDRTRQFFEQVSSPEKSLRIFDGFYHELIHEIEREKPIKDLREYLKKVV